MITIDAGPFLMGTGAAEAFAADGEGPVREVRLPAYRIAATAVTNTQFAAFVAETGHRTEAEAFGWSYVFGGLIPPDADVRVVWGRVDGAPWWRGVYGATWAAPLGPGSDLSGLGDHPVVHVSWADAVAYARWVGGRLPTEAEWEKAARGGLVQQRLPWGDELEPGGQHRMNVWQGTFPSVNAADDGWVGTAPVGTFTPNAYGLHETSGNVWEWTADWFSARWHRTPSEVNRVNPQGPRFGQARVVKGGSYLCHASYCNRYRVAARTATTPDSSLGHTGFRLAADVAP